MKKIHILVYLIVITAVQIQAQTLNVNENAQVTYAFNAADCGEMQYAANGTTLTIGGKTFSTSSLSSMTVDESTVSDNSVNVVFNSTTASVVIAGNIAPYVSATVNGANVVIDQVDTPAAEITYTLSGSSGAGSLTMNGTAAATFILRDLMLTSTTGAAIDIEGSNRINLILEGTNTLSDYAQGLQNACLYIGGNTAISGSGSLYLSGMAKHAFTSDDHLIMTSGNVVVSSAATDGLHMSEYFQMDGGSITINAQGDGIDVGFRGVTKGTKDEYPNNGFIMLNGGTLNVTTTGEATKGIKADSTIVCAGATVIASTSGTAIYDATAVDFSSCAAMKAGGKFRMTSGSVDLVSTGDGGKGLNAAGDIIIEGGTLTVTTTGKYFEAGDDDTKPHGVKSKGSIYLEGGNIYVAASGSSGTAFKTDNTFSISSGIIMGIGGKKCEPTIASQGYNLYNKIGISAGRTVSYNGVTYTVPSYYSNSNAKIIVSSPSM